jgi:hypothetical protein
MIAPITFGIDSGFSRASDSNATAEPIDRSTFHVPEFDSETTIADCFGVAASSFFLPHPQAIVFILM